MYQTPANNNEKNAKIVAEPRLNKKGLFILKSEKANQNEIRTTIAALESLTTAKIPKNIPLIIINILFRDSLSSKRRNKPQRKNMQLESCKAAEYFI